MEIRSTKEIMALSKVDLQFAFAQLQAFAAEVYRDGYGNDEDPDCPLAAAYVEAEAISEAMVEVTAKVKARLDIKRSLAVRKRQ